MARTSNKREKLLDAARELIHQQGYRYTTLAEIAEHSQVPLGNVYYYFKTKDDIASAVIQARKQQIGQMAEQWKRMYSDPRARLGAFLDYAESEKVSLVESGCPIGSLCQELNKEPGELTEEAGDMLKDMIAWVEAQFREMGGDNPAAQAVDLICSLQGIALMANSLRDSALVSEQVQRLRNRLAAV